MNILNCEWDDYFGHLHCKLYDENLLKHSKFYPKGAPCLQLFTPRKRKWSKPHSVKKEEEKYPPLQIKNITLLRCWTRSLGGLFSSQKSILVHPVLFECVIVMMADEAGQVNLTALLENNISVKLFLPTWTAVHCWKIDSFWNRMLLVELHARRTNGLRNLSSLVCQ